eukprot:9606317-Ditylum_brightwellii.AAC.1
MPNDTIKRIQHLACRDPLGMVIKDCTGTESMHDPPLEQMENDDNDSTYVPNEEGSEKDDDSIPSIDSLNEVAIYHNTDNFEPFTDTTDTTTTAIVDDDDIIVTVEENIPEDEIDGDNHRRLIVQDDKETSSSSSEEVSEEEPTETTRVQQEGEEDMMMENETLQANKKDRDVHVNVLPPTNESSNQQSIEDQIAHMEQEMDQAYGTTI